MLKFNNERIEKRLTKSFVMVSAISAIAAIVGLIAMLVLASRYSYALKNYGFAQGDIGQALFAFADTRSSLRAAIGYDDADAIQNVVEQHKEMKATFEEYFAKVEDTIVSKDGRETYDEIVSELDAYWEMDTQILELGATTDRELCKQAQDIALNELAGKYNSIYEKLEGLLTVKINEGNSLSTTLRILSIVLAAFIIVVIVSAMLVSTKMGKGIAKGIAKPLADLGQRLKALGGGDFSSPFPEVEADDEVADMVQDARDMSDKLNAIIDDLGLLLGEMSTGNYAVRTAIPEQYTGEFAKMLQAMRDLRNQMTATLRSIGEASNQVSAGSGNLAESAQGLAEGAVEQAGAVQELQATIISITEAMQRSAEDAGDSYTQTQKCAEEADNSREGMNTVVEAMKKIDDTSTKIGNIISEIESIASQTNLLALNAAVEAARAGDVGKGFAVVADEVRNLANKSDEAAKATRRLIESSIVAVTEGIEVVNKVTDSLELTNVNAGGVSVQMAAVVEAVESQTSAIS